MSGPGRFILSGFYQYLLIKIQMVWKACITQPDLPWGHLPEVLRTCEHTTPAYSVSPLRLTSEPSTNS